MTTIPIGPFAWERMLVLVILILVAVAVAPLWGRRLGAKAAYVATAAGWAVAMAIVVIAAAASKAGTRDLDVGFWLFNSLLLVVGLGLARLGSRGRARAVAA